MNKQSRRTESKPAELLDRSPPHSDDAEKGVLGSLFLDPHRADDVALIVRHEDFYNPHHQKLFEVMLAIHNAGKSIDITLVAERLKKSGDFEAMGREPFLAEIIANVPTAHNAVHYARIVSENAVLRALKRAAEQTLYDASNANADASAIVAEAESRMFEIAERNIGSEPMALGDVLVEAMQSIDERIKGAAKGLPTGYRVLDELTGGMRPGQLIIVAARPGLGKSIFSLNVATNCVVNQNARTLIVSLEMSRLEIGERLLASHGKIPLHHLTNNSLTPSERERLVEVSGELSEWGIVIDDSPDRTMTEIAAMCRRAKRRGGLDLVVIDYLTLVRPDNDRDQREEQVAKIARRVKVLARELKVPIMCLAQLNRDVAKTNDNRPQLHHLRSSGAIEQDADQCWFLHREDYYATSDGEREGKRGKAEIIVAKARNGRTGTAHVHWESRWGRFENIEPKLYDFD